MNMTAHVLVDEYLARLRAAARDLPASERRDLIESIEDHIAAGLDELGGNEAAIRTMLDDLGDPEQIVTVCRRLRALVTDGIPRVRCCVLSLDRQSRLPVLPVLPAGWTALAMDVPTVDATD
jgi:hypothetical protein